MTLCLMLRRELSWRNRVKTGSKKRHFSWRCEKAGDFPVDESYMANIANHLWMVEPLQKMWYSLYQLVHDFFHQWPCDNKDEESPSKLEIITILRLDVSRENHWCFWDPLATRWGDPLVPKFWRVTILVILGSVLLSHTHMTTSVLLQMFFLILTWVFFKRCFFCSKWTLEQN